MRIAIATDDRIHISSRTGRAKEFAIYQVSEGKVLEVSYIVNDAKHENHHDHADHEHGHSHAALVTQLKGVDLFLVQHLGKHFRKDIESAGIPYQMVNADRIERILANYMN